MGSLVVPVVSGFFIVSRSFPAVFRPTTLPLRVFLGTGIGMGLASSSYSAWYFLIGRPNFGYFASEAIGLAVVGGWYLRHAQSSAAVPCAPAVRAPVSSWLRVSWWLVVALSGVTYLLATVKYSHGTWDAWAIWNLRARFLFSGGSLGRTFSPLLAWSHPDYPVLVPGLVARSWQQLGVASPVAPMLVAALFTAATVGVLGTGLAALRHRTAGAVASLLLLGTPAFLVYGSSQVADIPLAYFMVATVVLMQLARAWPMRQHSLVVLAGCTAGMAAWTKNEGVLFLAIVAVVSVAETMARPVPWRQWIRWVLGVGPWLMLLAYFKIRWAPPNDLIALPVLQRTVHQLGQPERYWFLLRAFARETVGFGGWRFSAVLLLVVGAAASLAAGNRWLDNRVAHGMNLVMSAMLAGHFFIFLLDPYDLAWHVGTALNRLFLQLWPTLLFLFFLQISFPPVVEPVQTEAQRLP